MSLLLNSRQVVMSDQQATSHSEQNVSTETDVDGVNLFEYVIDAAIRNDSQSASHSSGSPVNGQRRMRSLRVKRYNDDGDEVRENISEPFSRPPRCTRRREARIPLFCLSTPRPIIPVRTSLQSLVDLSA